MRKLAGKLDGECGSAGNPRTLFGQRAMANQHRISSWVPGGNRLPRTESLIARRRAGAPSLEYALPLALFTLLVLFCFALNFAFTTSYQSSTVINSQINSLHWIDPKTDINAASRELAGRYLIQATYLLVFFASLVASVYSGAICFSQRMRLKLGHLVVISLLAVIAFLVSYVSDNSDYDPFWNSALPGYLTDAASGHAGFGMFDPLASWSCDVTILALCLSGAAVSVLIAVTPQSPEDLQEKLSSQRLLLFINAFLLIIYAVSVACALLWAAALLPQNEREEIIKLSAAAALSSGIINTLTIAGIHGAGFFVFARQARELAKAELPSATHEEREQFLSTHGLFASPYEIAVKILAVLSPLVAGLPITKLLTYFFA